MGIVTVIRVQRIDRVDVFFPSLLMRVDVFIILEVEEDGVTVIVYNSVKVIKLVRFCIGFVPRNRERERVREIDEVKGSILQRAFVFID